MVLEGLDCTSSRINAVVVWLYEHELTILFGEEFLDLFCALVVYHIQFYLVSLQKQ